MFQDLFRPRRRPQPKHRPTARIFLESLEDRLLLSISQLGAASAAVGDIQVMYNARNTFTDFPDYNKSGTLNGEGVGPDAPVFVIENTSGVAITGAVLTITPPGAAADSFQVGTIPAGGHVFVEPGVSNDGGTGHTFFAVTGSPLDTSDVGPSSSSTPFAFTGVQNGAPIASGVFTPTATAGPSNDGAESSINFLGNEDAPCNDCFGPNVVATLSNVGAAGQVQFAAALFSATKSNGTATITVTRTGDSTGTATVHYATSNGTAVAGQDYAAASGDLTFNPGETSKPVPISLLGGSVLTGTETVLLALSNPTGSTLGSQATAVLDLTDPVTKMNLTGPTVVPVGASNSYQVTLVNAAGNPVLGYRGTVQVAVQASGLRILPFTYTFTATDNGSHAFPVRFVSPGVQTLVVTDAALGVSAQLTVTANPAAATRLTLASASNPSTLGAAVTLTALVQSTNPAAGTPTGTVLFEENGVALGVVELDPAGRATFTIPDLAPGSHSLEAVYSGDDIYAGVGPAVLTQVVADQPVADVSALLSVRLGRARRRGRIRQQPISVLNVGGRMLEGPISLVLDRLPRRVRLLGATGRTSGGSPYLDLTLGPDNLLAPGAALSTTLVFVTPPGGSVRFLLHLLAGVGPR
jgi:hypothetical protein